jgi:hypothetical protein
MCGELTKSHFVNVSLFISLISRDTSLITSLKKLVDMSAQMRRVDPPVRNRRLLL